MSVAGDSAALPVASRGTSLALPLFAAALFLSAFLLFGVEPMFTKMVLPSLGGTPAVWSVAMVFFQGVLLIGYCYAHLLARLADLRIATVIHLVLMAAALCVMPIALDAGLGRPPASGEAFWLLRAFAAAVGLPFLAVAANGPLLQAWFARSGHLQASDPYFLYGASNIGSFAALVAYPLLIEPSLSLRLQSLAWTWGFAALAAAIVVCAIAAGAGSTARRPVLPALADAGEAVGIVAWRRRLMWIGLAAVPSGLLLAVTAHISTDVAAAPLSWIVPLALFLLTFVLAFRDPPLVDPTRLPLGLVALAALAWIVAPTTNINFVLGLGIHLGLFFVAALGAHATLYAARPKARQLTEFYVCMSFGGMLGGLFCGLVAPRVFSTVLEYPLLLGAAFFCRPNLLAGAGGRWTRDAIIVLATSILAWLAAYAAAAIPGNPFDIHAMRVAVLAIAAILVWRQALRCALFGVAMAAAFVLPSGQDGHVTTIRSFFGVHKIYETGDGRFRLLANGTTIHGAMRIRDDDGSPSTGRPEPLTYYFKGGSVAEAVEAVRSTRGRLRRVTAIGLGTGSLACARRDDEAWTFLEIDPVVVRIAGDPAFFRFLSACGPTPPIVLGDARLTLADMGGRSDLIVVDAFSSDAIPTHLLTAEAMALYRSRLETDGAIAFHISNRHLGLKRILARVAAANGLASYYRRDSARPQATQADLFAPSEVVIVTQDVDGVGKAAIARGWSRIDPDLARPAWTDDYSNILEAILDR